MRSILVDHAGDNDPAHAPRVASLVELRAILAELAPRAPVEGFDAPRSGFRG
jgi:hypothetical protein